MKKSVVSLFAGIIALATIQNVRADVLANWTFQTSASTNNIIGLGTTPSSTQSGVLADIGTGTARAFHATATTAWSIPAGNGSTNSWSANNWTVGDYYQFSASTIGFSGITISYDQVSSASGPGQFNFQYSTDGSTFTTFGSQYNVLVNASPNNWTSGTPIGTTSFSYNLISITALDNAATIYFRISDATGTSASIANGGATAFAATGTDRVDNFLISATPVPEPATLTLASLGGLACLIAMRRKR